LADERGHIDLMVKQYPNGKASTYLHSMSPGESLYFVAALKGHTWTPNKYSHITLVAGGAGITPMHQLIQGVLRNPEDKTQITLVFGVNSDEDVLLKKEFDDFEEQFPGRFKAIYTVSKPVESSPFRKGYITEALLEAVTVDPREENTKIFVCGPPAMEKALLGTRGFLNNSDGGILQRLGYRKDQIHQF
jgi:cytochrome-b5 reductase